MNSAGDRLAIGGIGGAGRTRIFEWNGNAWVQLGADIDGEAAGDQSGWSVSMNAAGDRLAIGARTNDGNGSNAGHVRIYDWNGTAWLQLGADIDGEGAGDEASTDIAAKRATDLVCELYRRQVWTDDRTVAILASAVESKNITVMSRAMRFFLNIEEKILYFDQYLLIF